LAATAEIPLENVEQFVHTKMGIAKLKTNVFSSGLSPKLIESNREGVKVTVVLDYWELWKLTVVLDYWELWKLTVVVDYCEAM
jgi:hypothetical protein